MGGDIKVGLFVVVLFNALFSTVGKKSGKISKCFVSELNVLY